MATAALLEVRAPEEAPTFPPGLLDRRGRRSYRETRLEPGDAVTIVGRALPFSDLRGPSRSRRRDRVGSVPRRSGDRCGPGGGPGDRGSGRRPDGRLGQCRDPGVRDRASGQRSADRPRGSSAAACRGRRSLRAERTFEIAPDTLVLAASDEVPLLIAYGIPGQVVDRRQTQFLVGLLGAILAIASAMVVAVSIGGGFGG